MKSLVIVIILFLAPVFCFSGGLSFQEKEKLRKAGYSNSQIRKMEKQIDRNQFQRMEPEYKYKSFTGNRYKYDLSRPDDRVKYELDIGAQIKDSVKMPTIEIDRGLNQHGGGID